MYIIYIIYCIIYKYILYFYVYNFKHYKTHLNYSKLHNPITENSQKYTHICTHM